MEVKKRRVQKQKISFSMKLDINDGISSTATKGPNKIVSREDVAFFIKEARERLDNLEKNWLQIYDKGDTKNERRFQV